LANYWFLRGSVRGGRTWLVREGRTWAEAMLERTDGSDRSAARGKALRGAGQLAWAEGDFQAASLLAEESLSIMRELEDKRASGYAEWLLGLVRMGQRNSAAARPLLEASRSLFQELGDVWNEASTLYPLGMAAYLSGEGAPARAYSQERLRLFRQVGDVFGMALLASTLEALGLSQGEEETVRSLYEQSLPLLGAAKDRARLGMVLINIGDNWQHHYGDAHQAKMLYKQGLKLWQDMQAVDNWLGIVMGLVGLADVAAAQGQAACA